jgi:hypothetical protein
MQCNYTDDRVEYAGAAVDASAGLDGSFSIYYMNAIRCTGACIVNHGYEAMADLMYANFINNTALNFGAAQTAGAVVWAVISGMYLTEVVFLGNDGADLGQDSVGASYRNQLRKCFFDKIPSSSCYTTGADFQITSLPVTVFLSPHDAHLCGPCPPTPAFAASLVLAPSGRRVRSEFEVRTVRSMGHFVAVWGDGSNSKIERVGRVSGFEGIA